jgi:membrane protein required for colicin V production
VANELIGFDYGLVAIIAVSTLISLFRGFFKEAISLGTWLAALWVAWIFGPEVAVYLEEWIAPTALRLWAARGIVFIGVLLVGGVLNALLHMLLQSTGLSGTDRAIGMVFGFGRGILLVGIVLAVMEAADFNETEWWPESALIPYFAPVTDMIRHAAEDGLELLDELDMSPDADVGEGLPDLPIG